MRAASRLLLLACLAGAATAPACRRGQRPAQPPPRPVLGTISLENLALPPEKDRLDPVAIEAELRRVLAASGLFAAGGGDAGTAPTARARLAFTAETVEADAKGESRTRVRLRVDTRPSDAPGAVAFDLEGQGAEPYALPPVRAKGRGAEPAAAPPPQKPSLTALVIRVVRDLVDGVAARRRLQEGAPGALHAALVADGGELREEAIRIVGERQLRDEVPTLLKLLSADDETVRDAALGALIAMRERRAVHELTQSRSLRDRREMRKIIEAISMIGGQEADEYLSFIAATHDDDEIRADAAAARARLQRREAEAGAAAR
jgi:hypothetical protein